MRLASHGVTVALLLLAIWLARIDVTTALSSVEARPFVPTARAPLLDSQATPSGVVPALGAFSAAPLEPATLTRLANPNTDIPSRPRYTIETHVVSKGETLFGIAANYNLKPDTILWGNPRLADNPNILSAGMELNILPINGALRVVEPGDTLEKIARVFHGEVEAILAFAGNDLDPTNPEPPLQRGQKIIIPDGWRDLVIWQLPIISRVSRGRGPAPEPGSCPGPFSGPSGTFTFVWPANNHYLSGTDYIPNGHPGVDVAAGLGAAVYASDTGVVVFAGVSTRGYGNLIIIDHGNGWQTAYAHLSQINVACGQGVFQGNLIGLSGSTGNSTGAHLHFEMRNDQYGRVNPWLYLP